MQLKIKFEGDLADEHRIPAYEGTKSLEGLTRSILIVSSYLVEGRVRRRNFGELPIEFNLIGTRAGSFETLYELGYQSAVFGGGLVVGVASNLLTDLLKKIYQRSAGQSESATKSDEMNDLLRDRGGDIEALVDAVEPSLRQGHNIINNGTMTININYNDKHQGEKPLARFDAQSKEYIRTTIGNDAVRVKLFSINNFNANQGTGNAFDDEESRSVRFEIFSSADAETYAVILESLRNYVGKRRFQANANSFVYLRYISVDSVNGRVKKIIILSARNNLEDFNR